MKTLLATAAIIAALSGSASAGALWTTLADAAPRSVFDDLNTAAPRSLFDTLSDTAPRSASPRDLVGELQPEFDSLRDGAP